MQFITDKHELMLRNHDLFQQEATVYSENMCGKLTRARGIKLSELLPKLEFFKSLGPTSSEILWVEEFLDKHSRARCCLPKGHAGPCMHKLDAAVPSSFKSKIADCHRTPGDKGLFMNRAARHFPIQLLRSARIQLGKVDTPFAIPLEFSGTGFTTATAYFDWASLLTLQQGFVANDFYSSHISKYREHAEFLARYYLSSYRLKIVNDEGYLCDPFTFETLKLQWWNEGHHIQFGHVLPVSDTEYRTRGMNIIPMTRETNMLQGDRPWTQFIEELKVHIAKH